MKVYLWECESEDEGREVLGVFSTLARALEEAGGPNNQPLDGPKVSSVLGRNYWERDIRPWSVDGRGFSFIVTEAEVEQ